VKEAGGVGDTIVGIVMKILYPWDSPIINCSPILNGIFWDALITCSKALIAPIYLRNDVRALLHGRTTGNGRWL
jgi:hypothetical protein